MSGRETEDGQTTGRIRAAAAVALIGVVAPVVTALVLLIVGPHQLTAHKHPDWQPLYFLPSALAFLGGILAFRHGSRSRRRGLRGHEFLWFVSALSFLISVALLLFGAYALLMSSIGVEDGGWD
ncbi:hypothetical protein [Actinomadura alba]|uniref:DUF4190 domain-containing protein n=1 Tax=Actinomadura alba TaxID=406431 RepID=A0ABR7LTP3_9ACTN|nr:hypothetical protein [Actinomadura alba]MBC6468116.1 hypothetical protein [Actinomadura alba]